MAVKFERNFSDENICTILMAFGFITEDQKQEILVKRERLKRKLEQLQIMRTSSTGSKGAIRNPVNIIDIISYLEIERADDSARILDEEIMFQALAKAWKIPYKKMSKKWTPIICVIWCQNVINYQELLQVFSISVYTETLHSVPDGHPCHSKNSGCL